MGKKSDRFLAWLSLPIVVPLVLVGAGIFTFFSGVKWLATGLVPWLRLRYGECAETRATYIDRSGHHEDDDWCFRYQFRVSGRRFTGAMSSGYDMAHAVLSGYEVPELDVLTAPDAILITYLVQDPGIHRAARPKELDVLDKLPPVRRKSFPRLGSRTTASSE